MIRLDLVLWIISYYTMSFIVGSFLDHFWIISGSFLDHFWIISGSFLDHFWIISGSWSARFFLNHGSFSNGYLIAKYIKYTVIWLLFHSLIISNLYQYLSLSTCLFSCVQQTTVQEKNTLSYQNNRYRWFTCCKLHVAQCMQQNKKWTATHTTMNTLKRMHCALVHVGFFKTITIIIIICTVI